MHKVREGDTLLGVSLDYGVSPAAIKKSNGITSDENILFERTENRKTRLVDSIWRCKHPRKIEKEKTDDY
jgi:hypothetical protein